MLLLAAKQPPAYGRGKATQDIQIPQHRVSTQSITLQTEQFSHARWLHQCGFQMRQCSIYTVISISICPYLDKKQQLVTRIQGRHAPCWLLCNWYDSSILASQKSLSQLSPSYRNCKVLYLQLLLGCLMPNRMWLGMGLQPLMAVWTEYQDVRISPDVTSG